MCQQKINGIYLSQYRTAYSTVYSNSSGIDNTEFKEIAEITVGDSDTENYVIYSNVSIQFPNIKKYDSRISSMFSRR